MFLKGTKMTHLLRKTFGLKKLMILQWLATNRGPQLVNTQRVRDCKVLSLNGIPFPQRLRNLCERGAVVARLEERRGA